MKSTVSIPPRFRASDLVLRRCQRMQRRNQILFSLQRRMIQLCCLCRKQSPCAASALCDLSPRETSAQDSCDSFPTTHSRLFTLVLTLLNVAYNIGAWCDCGGFRQTILALLQDLGKADKLHKVLTSCRLRRSRAAPGGGCSGRASADYSRRLQIV